MKRLFLLFLLFLGLLPDMKGDKLTFTSGYTASAQNYSVEQDSTGNMFFPIDQGDLPPDDGTETQNGEMSCVFKSLEIISNYFGDDLNEWDLAGDYADGHGMNINVVMNDHELGGIMSSQVEGYLDNFYNATPISGWDLFENYQNGNPALGQFQNESGAYHMVIIVSSDIGGTTEFFDPATGHYDSAYVGDFSQIYSITPKDPFP